MSEPIQFTVKGQPPSKSNSYRIISLPDYKNKKGKQIKAHSALGKTKELKSYEELFLLQIPAKYRGLLIEKVMRVEIDCYFLSMRPDLDNAAKCPLDLLQRGNVIKNDNRVIELLMRKFIDKSDPRMEITIKKLGL